MVYGLCGRPLGCVRRIGNYFQDTLSYFCGDETVRIDKDYFLKVRRSAKTFSFRNVKFLVVREQWGASYL